LASRTLPSALSSIRPVPRRRSRRNSRSRCLRPPPVG
jgi:hypothetical protein